MNCDRMGTNRRSVLLATFNTRGPRFFVLEIEGAGGVCSVIRRWASLLSSASRACSPFFHPRILSRRPIFLIEVEAEKQSRASPSAWLGRRWRRRMAQVPRPGAGFERIVSSFSSAMVALRSLNKELRETDERTWHGGESRAGRRPGFWCSFCSVEFRRWRSTGLDSGCRSRYLLRSLALPWGEHWAVFSFAGDLSSPG